MQLFYKKKNNTIQVCKPGANFQGKSTAFWLNLIGSSEVSPKWLEQKSQISAEK